MAITASARRNHPPARSPAHAASTENPAKPSARRSEVALVAAGERVDAADRAPRRRLGAHQPPGPARLDGVAAVPRQGGDDVQLVAAAGQLVRRCASAPARSARCRARSAARARRAAARRASLIDRQRRAGRRRRGGRRRPPVVNPAARRWPAATRSSRSRAHLVEGVRPRVDGRAGARGRRRRRPRAGGPVAAHHRRAERPSPRAPAHRSPRTRTGTRAPSAAAINPSRSSAGTRPVRTTRASQAEARRWPPSRRRRRGRRRRAARARRSGSLHGPASSSSRKRWFLCGWVIAGYTTNGRSPSP